MHIAQAGERKRAAYTLMKCIYTCLLDHTRYTLCRYDMYIVQADKSIHTSPYAFGGMFPFLWSNSAIPVRIQIALLLALFA